MLRVGNDTLIHPLLCSSKHLLIQKNLVPTSELRGFVTGRKWRIRSINMSSRVTYVKWTKVSIGSASTNSTYSHDKELAWISFVVFLNLKGKRALSIKWNVNSLLFYKVRIIWGQGTLEEWFIRVKFSTRISVTKHVLRHRVDSILLCAWTAGTTLPIDKQKGKDWAS